MASFLFKKMGYIFEINVDPPNMQDIVFPDAAFARD